MAFLPLSTSIKDVFKSAIDEANQMGNFLLNNFLITNIKSIEHWELKEIFDKITKGEDVDLIQA